jgi:CIC family chloride channel protein
MERLSHGLGTLLDRFQPPPALVLLATALVVGLLTGIGAIIFRYLINAVTWIGYVWFPSVAVGIGTAYVVLVPAVGGLIVGVLVYVFAREAKGHGVPEVMEAVALRGGRIRPVVAVVKALASAVCIGSGGSAGREGPIVQIGSSIGSSIGQALRLSDDRVRNLVACGAAAGIAATFNAPIAGVMFALEVILGEFGVQYLSTVVIAAVTASVIGKAAFGDVPAFPIPTEYGVQSPWEYVLYAALAVLAAVVGFAFVRTLYGTEDLFDRWTGAPEWFKPAVGGALLGLVALAYPVVTSAHWRGVPHVYNVGYEVIEGALENHYALAVVAVLLVVKLLATSLTLGSGGSGGVFAPSLFMGAMLGSSFALVVERIAPGLVAAPGAYALVGMAAVFAAAAHAPITAFLIVFELTSDYGLILPLMLTVVIATVLGQRLLGGESIYTLKLARRGVRISAGRDTDVLDGVTVAEAMATDFVTVHAGMSIAELSRTVAQHRRLGFPVLDDKGMLWGIVTVEDLDRALEAGGPSSTVVREIGTTRPRLQVAFPDEAMGSALSRMGERGVGRLPVVAREDTSRLVGLIRRDDIVRAYNLALTRREALEQRVKRMQVRETDGTGFIEIQLGSEDAAAGKSIRDVAANAQLDWIIVSVTRDGRTMIPRGDTVLQPGDLLAVFARRDDAEDLRGTIRGGRSS